MASPTIENYLKAIYTLAERADQTGLARLGDLAGELDVTPGTITTMIRGLHERGLVDYLPRKGVRLTEAGRVEALQVLRRHRLIETFLVQIMDMDWSEVHEDAEALEHAVSDRLVERMAEMLGHPSEDPHGDPIPTLDSEVHTPRSRPLSEVDPGSYRVLRIRDQHSDFLEWIDESGLRPGTVFELLQRDVRAGALTVKVGKSSTPLPVGLPYARNIRVEPYA